MLGVLGSADLELSLVLTTLVRAAPAVAEGHQQQGQQQAGRPARQVRMGAQRMGSQPSIRRPSALHRAAG